MTKRTLIGIGAAAVAIGVVIVVPAWGQGDDDLPETDVSSSFKLSSTRAGTPTRPKGVRATVTTTLTTEPGFDPPIVTGLDVLLGPGISLHGGDYVTCTKRALDRQGPKGCPRESIMGAGVATAKADTVNTRLKFVLVNGGAKRLLAYTTLTNPARVEETIVVKETAMTGKWSHSESFRVPKSLQVVAGIPIQVTKMRLSIGGKPYARSFITTTSCPKGGWKQRVTAHYLYDLIGQTTMSTSNGSISCRR